MGKVIVIESMYLPPLEFFCLAMKAEEIKLERYEHYTKQTYRNRCQILGPNKVQSLVVPVLHEVRMMSELRIDYSGRWFMEHWRSLETAYNKSPYMEYYRDELWDIYARKTEFLFEFNRMLLTFCLNKLGISAVLSDTQKYNRDYSESGILDMRGHILPKVSYAQRAIYRPVAYFQQFGRTFEPNLSIVDLLMSAGPTSREILRESVVQY